MTDLSKIEKSIEVMRPRDEAFKLFTAGFASWWPTETHSVGGSKVNELFFEEREGGRVYERWSDGTEFDWAIITAWDPPSHLAMSWNPSPDNDIPTDVAVTFHESERGTKVELVHSGWERMGDEGSEMHQNYLTGWDPVLARFSDTA